MPVRTVMISELGFVYFLANMEDKNAVKIWTRKNKVSTADYIEIKTASIRLRN